MRPPIFFLVLFLMAFAAERGSVWALIPLVHLQQTIEPTGVASGCLVKQLAFSPDGRYLAIFATPDLFQGILIIWDLRNNREQARMTGLSAGLGNNFRTKILWSHDGSFITFGTSHRQVQINPPSSWQMTLWNPMTGRKIRDLDIRAANGCLNRDGTKLLVATGTLLHQSFRIYDTKNWNFQEYEMDGLQIALGVLGWNSDDKVVAIGSWDGNYKGPFPPRIKGGDIVARLIDPANRRVLKNCLLAPSQPAPSDPQQFIPTFTPRWLCEDFSSNRIAVGLGRIMVLSGDSLQVLATYNPPTSKCGPFGDLAYSPDGNYLYVMDSRDFGQGESIILDARTGNRVGSFPGGTLGFSVSQSGNKMALGSWEAVKIFSSE